MSGILIALAIISPTAALIAWVAWLIFNYRIAREHGVDGLRAAPDVSKAFNLHEWIAAAPAQLLRSIVERFTPGPPA